MVIRDLLLIAGLLATVASNAQENGPEPNVKEPAAYEFYSTFGLETIFTYPVLDVAGSDKGGVVRFTPFFNWQWGVNYDLGKHFGLFTGISSRNQGFIYQVPDTTVRYKFRTYNVGIPIGFKVGRMNHTLIYAGYEVELPFNYQEKRFENERKVDKFNVGLSDRTERLFHSIFIGFQGPGSSTFTVRYYLSNFHNTDFTENKDGVTSQPYADLNANVIAISFGYGLFDGRVTDPDLKRPMDVQARW